MDCTLNHDITKKDADDYFNRMFNNNEDFMEKICQELKEKGYCDEVFSNILMQYYIQFGFNTIYYINSAYGMIKFDLLMSIFKVLSELLGIKIVALDDNNKSVH